jgi:hypothetical protein
MAIFGTQAPKYEIGGTTVNLDFSNILRDEPEINVAVHQSKLSGDRYIVNRFKHWNFDVMINLFKYSSPLNFYQLLKGHEGQLVDKLWRHRDGDFFKDAAGDPVKFYLAEVTAAALENILWRDLVLLRFQSVSNIAEDYAVAVPPQISEVTVLTPK